MKRHYFLASILIIATSIIAIASAWHDSPIVDEVPHIGSAYSYVSLQSYQFNPEHPPLAKDLAGLAMSTLDLKAPAQIQRPSNDQWNFGRQLIYSSGNDAIKVVHTAKLPLILFFVFSGIIIFAWTRKIYGDKAALLATALFCLSPTVIAHSRLVTTDVPALFGVLLSSYFFIGYLKNQTKKNFWLAVLTFGISELTKFSMVLLVPYFGIITVLWAIGHRYSFKELISSLGKTVAVIALGFILVVGPIYQLHIKNYSAQQQKTDAQVILQSYGSSLLSDSVIWASDKPVLRPFAQYGLGVTMVIQRVEGGNRMYFFGAVYNNGLKKYFPLVYGLKEPIPFLILLVLAICIGLSSCFKKSRQKFRNWLKNNFTQASMLVWLVIYWLFSINSTVDIGIRHLMPVYGFTYILVAGQISTFGKYLWERYGHKAGQIYKFAGFALMGWLLIEVVAAYPYYLPYFNEFAQIRPSWTANEGAGYVKGGHNYVGDSNLDWGQDLWRLADWVKDNDVPKIYLNYFGWADQSYYLGDKFVWMQGGQYTTREQFLRENPNGGYLAVSATFYEESIHTDKAYYWLASIKPIAVIGHSIFVWHIVP